MTATLKFVQRRMAGGAAWMTGLTLVDRSIGFVSTLILARILMPADFGLVAMCTAVMAALRIFTSFGFDIVLIQRQERATREHYDTVWTLRLLLSGTIACLMWAGAGPASEYYGEPNVVLPMQILALNFLFRSLENIAVVDFRKHLEFHKEFTFTLAQRLSGFVVTIPLAWYLESYWALIAGMVCSNIVAVAASYVMKPCRPTLCLKQTPDVFSFSIWMFANNLGQAIRERGSHLVVGRSGAESLGYFQISQELTMLSTQIIASVNRAVYPGYSRVADDPGALTLTFANVLSMAALIAVPMGFGLSAIAVIAVPVLLGPQWSPAIEPMAILAFQGTVVALTSNTAYILFARNRPEIVTYISLSQAVILLPTLVLMTTHFGLSGAAWSILGASLISFPVLVGIVARELNLGVGALLECFWRPVVASVPMYILVDWWAGGVPSPGLGDLAACLLLGVAAYLVSMTLLVWLFSGNRGVERALIAAVWRQNMSKGAAG